MKTNFANKTSMVTLKSHPLILNPKLAKKLNETFARWTFISPTIHQR